MPSSHEWLTFSDWAMKWGDIVSIKVLSQRIIVVSSVDMAIAMMQKKSLIYSDRPVLQMCGETLGWKNHLVLVPYGNRFRNYRKHSAQFFGSRPPVNRFLPLQVTQTRRFLRRLLEAPTRFSEHNRKLAISLR
jgi:hypothetical protein